jgi:hypothetical protein
VNEEGDFLVDYTRGDPPFTATGFAPAGSFKAKGRQDGDKLVFRWTNKSGDDYELTLKKVDENKVAARQERAYGSADPKKRPYVETYLNRR